MIFTSKFDEYLIHGIPYRIEVIAMLFMEHELKILMNTLSQSFILEAARFKSTFFTRQRRMTFSQIVLFIINGFKTSTQAALNRFFHDSIDMENTMSQQAFTEHIGETLVELYIRNG